MSLQIIFFPNERTEDFIAFIHWQKTKSTSWHRAFLSVHYRTVTIWNSFFHYVIVFITYYSDLLLRFHSSTYQSLDFIFEILVFSLILFLLINCLRFLQIRIVIILLGGIFTRVRRLMMTFPIYVTWLWFYDPVCLTCK